MEVCLQNPVHKKGSKVDVMDCRPISKMCLIAKLFEKILHKQLYCTFKSSFSDYQHGFIKGRSTISNLILLDEYITDNTDVYTDYTKCFDKIYHNILIYKLKSIGIHGDLLRWFISYISNRTQAVAIKTTYLVG